MLTLAHQSLTDTKKGPLKSDPLVIRLGFEPKTHSLEGCCSIQLSYQTCLYFTGSFEPTPIAESIASALSDAKLIIFFYISMILSGFVVKVFAKDSETTNNRLSKPPKTNKGTAKCRPPKGYR